MRPPPPFTRSLAVALGRSGPELGPAAGEAEGMEATREKLSLPIGTGLAGAAALARTPLRHPGDAATVAPEPDLGTAMAVPFTSRGQLLGVVAVYGHIG